MTARTQKGFTTIELALVMIIFGLIITVVFTAFKFYNIQKVGTSNDDALETTMAALTEFRIIHGRYPCPADPDLAPNNANYGVERCNGAGIVTTVGERDIVIETPANIPDEVFIGAVPIRTMVLGPDLVPNTFDEISFVDDAADAMIVDAWARRLTYAVTRHLTNAARYNDAFGVIDVVDENDQSILGIPDTAHLVLLSHGPNGVGAYSRTGTQVEACPGALPVAVFPEVASAVNEVENCDNDARFLSGLVSERDHSYNDDITRYMINSSSGLWVDTGITLIGGVQVRQINNTNTGNVGIGSAMDSPAEQLHIDGNLMATRLQAENYCDNTGANCIPSDLFQSSATTAPMVCDNPGEVVVAIQNNQVVCAPAFAGVNMTCPNGWFMHGISNISGAICCQIGGAPGSCP